MERVHKLDEECSKRLIENLGLGADEPHPHLRLEEDLGPHYSWNGQKKRLQKSYSFELVHEDGSPFTRHDRDHKGDIFYGRKGDLLIYDCEVVGFRSGCEGLLRKDEKPERPENKTNKKNCERSVLISEAALNILHHRRVKILTDYVNKIAA